MDDFQLGSVIREYHGVEILKVPPMIPPIVSSIVNGRYEDNEIAVAKEYLKPNSTIVEMGTGVGIVAAIIAKNCNPKKLVAFEANYKLQDSILDLFLHNRLDEILELRNEIVVSDPNAPPKIDFLVRGNFLGSGIEIKRAPFEFSTFR